MMGTPIFNALYKQQNLKPHRQSFNDRAGLLDKVRRTHTLCFDIQDILEPIKDIVPELTRYMDQDVQCFYDRVKLPSDGVWLESSNLGYFITNGESCDQWRVAVANKAASGEMPQGSMSVLPELVAAIWLINTPNTVRLTRVSSNRKHRASAATAQWMTGDYTRVQLCIDGRVIDVAASHDGHGQMPWHYVRRHYKQTLQRWIEGYWRGNKEIGTRHAQYHCCSG
ncbi:MAG: hypothetical protein GY942_03450 [Aestuariibacter sp.]|nr:hypothetical protein [Aestuariibacter sp.]